MSAKKYTTPHGDQIQPMTKLEWLLFDLEGLVVGKTFTRQNATRIIQALNAFDKARARKGQKT